MLTKKYEVVVVEGDRFVDGLLEITIGQNTVQMRPNDAEKLADSIPALIQDSKRRAR